MLRFMHPGCPSASSVQISASSLLCSLLQPLAVSIPVPVVLVPEAGGSCGSLVMVSTGRKMVPLPCLWAELSGAAAPRDAKLRRSHGVCELHL